MMRLSLNVVVITLVWSFGGGLALQPLQAQSQVRSHSGVERVANEMPLPRDYSARAAENSDMKVLERASVCARPLKAVARETMKIFSRSSLSALAFAFALGPQGIAAAAVDCETDCLSNCARVAPGNKAYQDECTDYCQQPDRQDGLSGSVSSDKGYIGLASPLRAGGTVEYGADRPPTPPPVVQRLLEPLKDRINKRDE